MMTSQVSRVACAPMAPRLLQSVTLLRRQPRSQELLNDAADATPLTSVSVLPVWRRSWKCVSERPASASAGRHTRRRKLPSRNGTPVGLVNTSASGGLAVNVACDEPAHRRARTHRRSFASPARSGKKWPMHQPYESGSVTPNAIKIAMRAKQAPVSRSVLILGMKSMK
jgi:hypothetical protein